MMKYSGCLQYYDPPIRAGQRPGERGAGHPEMVVNSRWNRQVDQALVPIVRTAGRAETETETQSDLT